MSTECIYIILGCFGLSHDGFVSCAGVENSILKIDASVQHYNEIIDYLDGCRLFDRPLFDQQAIKHFIFNVRDRYDQTIIGKRIWSEKQFELYQKFIIDHRLCGIYLKLSLTGNLQSEEPAEKSFLIKSKPFGEEPSQHQNLVLIRGRK